ncbi:MAG: MFS transporter [Chloroflexi bacterium]|nr:MFS transporter [Chloroflexota bacterium]
MNSRYRFVVEFLLAGLLLCVGLLWLAPGPLFPLIMKDYGVDRVTVGLTTSIMSLAMGMAAIPAGILASKIGLRKSFGIGAFLMAAGLLTPLSTGIISLIGTRVVTALGVAMLFPIASGLAMQWFHSKDMPLINGINMSATTIGNSIALFLTFSLAQTSGWERALAIYGAVAFVMALGWLVFGRESKPSIAGPGETLEKSPPVKIGAVLRQRNTLLLGLSVTGPFIAFMAMSSWLPTYYNEVFDMPLSRASAITGLIPLFGIPACIIGGILPLRIGLRKPFLLVPGIIQVFAALGTFMVDNPAIIYVSIALFGMSGLIFIPTVFTIAMELPGSNSKTAALIIAGALAVGNVAGFAGPVIVGSLADLTGSYLPGFIISSILSLTLFSALLLPETGPKKKAAVAAK